MAYAYVYLHRNRKTGEVFYVGKGTGGRAKESNGRSQAWREYAFGIGYLYDIEYVAEDLTEGEAYMLEEKVIEEYGLENLVNVYPGGRAWKKCSSIICDKCGFECLDASNLSTHQRGQKCRPEWRGLSKKEREKLYKREWADNKRKSNPKIDKSKFFKELWKNRPELKEQASIRMKKQWSDETFRNEMSQIRKDMWSDETFREKMKDIHTGRSLSEEHKLNISKSITEWWRDIDK